MNISLESDAEELIRTELKTGRYANAAEVVLAALHALGEREAGLAELRLQVAAGLDAARKGDLSDGDAFFAELEQQENARSNPDQKTA